METSDTATTQEVVPMEAEEQPAMEIVNISTVCRICGDQLREKLMNFYDEEGRSNELAKKINLYLPIKVTENDRLPLQSCISCATAVIMWHDLYLRAAESDRNFQSGYFDMESRLETIDIQIKSLDEEDEEDVDEPDALHANAVLDSDSNDTNPQETKELTAVIKSENPQVFESVANLESKTCRKCSNLKFHTRTALKEHVLKMHNIKWQVKRRRRKEIVPSFVCDLCSKGFTRKFDMDKHRISVHNLTEQVQAQDERKQNLEIVRRCRLEDSTNGRHYKCDFCGRIFSQSYNLMRHRTVHTGIKSFSCHICGKTFRMSSGLARHLSEVHYGIKKFTCEECGRKFAAKASLDEHMNIHTDSRPFVCDQCGKGFRQRASLTIHKLFHSEVFRFECKTCGKKFRRARDLKVHEWMHTGQKPYGCMKCHVTFRRSQDLNRHLKTHEVRPEATCQECGSIFKQARYLKVHMKIHNK